MEIFNHTFVNAHIIGCSPVKKIDTELKSEPYYYQFELYTTGGLHKFTSEKFIIAGLSLNAAMQTYDQKLADINNHNIKVNIWKEAADRYINFIESLNPSNYDNN